MILLPGETPGSVGDLLLEGLARIGVTGYKHGPVLDLDETLSRISELDINSLVGVPSQVMALVQFSKIHRSKYPVKMKSILLSTDYVPQSILKAIKKEWNCEVFNHYGMTEMGLGGGVFCSAQTGYHLREADLYFEIIDPVSGRILPDGEEGEVVFTTLTRRGMPLVRYRTGDLSRFLTEKCPCGTKLKTLEKIRGRVSQKVKIGSDFFMIGDFDEVLYQVEGLLSYQLEILHSPTNDKLVLTVFSINAESNLKEDILNTLHSFLANTLNVEIAIEIIQGYPPELGSMRKKQINEKSIEIDRI